MSRTIGSVRVAERLGKFKASLAPYSKAPRVIEFGEQYRMTTQTLT